MDHSLTLKQLRCLVTIAETAHFRLAAERLDITQPALTAQIQKLEQILETKLFERGRAGAKPTPLGREIIVRARQVLEETTALTEYALSAQKGVQGTLRLGVTPTLGPYLMPEVVASLHRQYADFRLYIREGAPVDLDVDLANGRHDVILTQLPSTSEDFCEMPLISEPLYLTMADDHTLVRQKSLSPEDLKGQDVLSLNPRYRLAEQISRFCERHGAHVQTDYEGTSLDAIRQMVGMNMGIAFLPALYVLSELDQHDGVAIRALKGRGMQRSMGLVHRKRSAQTPSIEALATAIKTVADTKLKKLKI